MIDGIRAPRVLALGGGRPDPFAEGRTARLCREGRRRGAKSPAERKYGAKTPKASGAA